MRILFVTYDDARPEGSGARSDAMIRALAEAGHRIDVIAARAELRDHPNIRVLLGRGDQPASRRAIRSATRRAAKNTTYDAAHAVDFAVASVSRLFRLRGTPLVYDASRCFSGAFGLAPSVAWRLFPRSRAKREQRVLSRAAAILAPCARLVADLKKISPDARVRRLDHAAPSVPASTLEFDRGALSKELGVPAPCVIACSSSPESDEEARLALMAARKIHERHPKAVFVFSGRSMDKLEALAANLDLAGRCLFFDEVDVARFARVLAFADVALHIATPNDRYARPEVFLPLGSQAPLVVAHDGEYDDVLSDENSVRAARDVSSIKEAVLHVLDEPLFSIGVAVNGQRLVAERYSLSSFKHRARMIYHQVFQGE